MYIKVVLSVLFYRRLRRYNILSRRCEGFCLDEVEAVVVGIPEFGLDLSNGETMAALNGAVSSYGSLIFTLGTILIALVYASNKEGGLKIGAYITALAFLVSFVVQLISWVDTSIWTLTGSVAGISYIVVSIWNVFVGRDLMKKA